MNKTKLKAGFIAAIAAIALISCGSKGVSDQQLTSDIQSKLSADPTTKGTNINVAANNGTVTLSGSVPSSDVELQAMKIANGTTGVKGVNDQMAVNAAASAAPPAPASSGYPPAVGAPPSQRREGRRRDEERREGVTLPAGQRLTVRMTDSIDSGANSPGQTFRAALDVPITSGDRVVVPAGTPCTVTLVSAAEAGRLRGQSALEVRLTSIDYRGASIPVNTGPIEEAGKERGKQTLERTGAGAAAGAVIGALAGHGKGAAIGAAAGGGAGLGYNYFTHGSQVKIPAETVLTFRLQAPASL